MSSSKKPSRKSIDRFEGEGGTTEAGELARKKRPPDVNQLTNVGTDEAENRKPAPHAGKIRAGGARSRK
jgi:hypothetical protein